MAKLVSQIGTTLHVLFGEVVVPLTVNRVIYKATDDNGRELIVTMTATAEISSRPYSLTVVDVIDTESKRILSDATARVAKLTGAR